MGRGYLLVRDDEVLLMEGRARGSSSGDEHLCGSLVSCAKGSVMACRSEVPAEGALE